MAPRAPLGLATAGFIGVIATGALVILLTPPIDIRTVLMLAVLSVGTALAVGWGIVTAGNTDTPYW